MVELDAIRVIGEKTTQVWSMCNIKNVVIPVQYENVDEEDDVKQAKKKNKPEDMYARTTIIDVDTRQVETGQTGMSEHLSMFHVDLFFQKETGTATPRILMADLIEKFRIANTLPSVRDSRCNVRQGELKSPKGRMDSEWMMYKVIVPIRVWIPYVGLADISQGIVDNTKFSNAIGCEFESIIDGYIEGGGRPDFTDAIKRGRR